MKLLTTIIGSLSAVATTAAWLPQVIQSWRTRSAEDFSWGYLWLFSAGVAGWTVYGVLKRDGVIVAANAITLMLVIVVMVVKLREVRRER